MVLGAALLLISLVAMPDAKAQTVLCDQTTVDAIYCPPIPIGVTRVRITAIGGGGGDGGWCHTDGGAGAPGAQIVVEVNVLGGEHISGMVGGRGAQAFPVSISPVVCNRAISGDGGEGNFGAGEGGKGGGSWGNGGGSPGGGGGGGSLVIIGDASVIAGGGGGGGGAMGDGTHPAVAGLNGRTLSATTLTTNKNDCVGSFRNGSAGAESWTALWTTPPPGGAGGGGGGGYAAPAIGGGGGKAGTYRVGVAVPVVKGGEGGEGGASCTWGSGSNTLVGTPQYTPAATQLTGRVRIVDVTPPVILTFNKSIGVGGRVDPSDQFMVDIIDAAGNVMNATTQSTTTGAGASVISGSGTTGPTAVPAGKPHRLVERMAPGSASTLNLYSATLSCTGTRQDGMALTGLPNGIAYNTMSPGYALPALPSGANVTCTVTNTPNLIPISGRVFNDNGTGAGVGNNGIRDGGEAPLPG
ncbi:MAG: hypothetical protein QM639_15180, partial [Rhodocyclaceae bacterium]